MTTRFRPDAFIVQDSAGNALHDVHITLWTAETGGSKVTALTEPDSATPLPGYVPTNAKGQWPFDDPADHNSLWAQGPAAAGQPLPPRISIKSVESDEATGIIGAQFPAVKAAAEQASADVGQLRPDVLAGIGRSTDALELAGKALLASSDAFATNAIKAGADTATDSNPATNLAAINDALQSGDVFLPAGTFLINGEILVPSNRRLFGAGMDKTIIKMINGVDLQKNVITNAGNTRVEHATLDKNIWIADLTVDSNGLNRSGAGPHVATSGCGVGLAAVRDCVVERVRSINGSQHCFDIGASIYAYETVVTAYPQGASDNVVIRDCIGIDPTGDDAFTAHCSTNVRFEGCKALFTGAFALSSVQQGFEIDDGMVGSVVRDCYAKGFVRGFQAKGHQLNPPARRILFDNCVAEGCSISYSISHVDQSTITPAPGYRVAADIELRGCKSIAPVQTHSSVTHFMAVELNAYDNVRITNIVLKGGAHNDIQINNTASNVVIDGVTAEDCWAVPFSATSGLIQITATAGDNITVRNVNVRSTIGGSAVRCDKTTGKWSVQNVVAVSSTTSVPCVYFAVLNAQASAREIRSSGFSNDIRVNAAPYVGNYARSVKTVTWTAITPNTGYDQVNASTDQFRYSYDDGIVTIDCNVKPTSGTLTAGTIQVSATGALPDALRPDSNRNFLGTDQSGRAIRVAINAAGTIQLVVLTGAVSNYCIGQFSYRP